MDSFLLSSAVNRRNKISNASLLLPAAEGIHSSEGGGGRRSKTKHTTNRQSIETSEETGSSTSEKESGSHRSSEVCDIRPRSSNNKQDLQGMMCVGRRERQRQRQNMRDAKKAEHAIARQRREKERQREKRTSRVVIIASKTGTAIRYSLR